MKNNARFATCDKEKLGYDKIFVNANLCPYYSHISWKCRKLRKANHIYATWEINGTVVLKLHENDKYLKILHESDLDNLFPNFDFDNSDVSTGSTTQL